MSKPEQMTREEYQAYLSQPKSASKYGNKRGIGEDGLAYDSQANHRYEGLLKLRIKAGEILSYDKEIDLPLIGPKGTLLGHYRCDFIIYLPDQTRQIIDIKSPATAKEKLFIWKKKHVEDQYGEPVVLIDSKTLQPIGPKARAKAKIRKK